MRHAFAVAFTLAAGSAAAQTPAPEAGAAAGRWVFETGASAVHQFESGLDRGGDLSINRVFGQASVGYAFDRRTSVSLSVSGGITDYDFGDGATLGGSEPWGRIDELRLSLPVRFGIGDSIDAIVIPTVRWNVEDGASFDDGRTEGIIAGAAYRFTPSFAIGPGIGVFSQLSDDANIFPILLLDWDVTDRINVGTASGFGATQGPGLEVSYRFDNGLRVGAGARVEFVEFRLDDEGVAPEGIGELRTVPIFLTASFTPSPMTTLSAIAGLDVAGEVTLMDRDGREIESRGIDAAPFIGLSGRLRF